MIKNENGSILIVTLAFVLVFTLLGFGTIHYAYVQNEIAEKEKASAKAFWIVDGAVEKAWELLRNNPNQSDVDDVAFEGGTYYVHYDAGCTPGPNCDFEAQGLTGGQYRTIRASVDNDVHGNLVFTSWKEI